MAQIKYRANLAGKSFPLLADWQAQTVIIPQADNPYFRYGTPEERIRDVAVPSACYMHNVLPTIEGYKSVGIRSVGNNTAILATGAYALRLVILQNAGINYPVIELSNGTFYILDETFFAPVALAGGNTVGATVVSPDVTTYASVAGTTYAYMYYAGAGKFSQFDGANFNNVVPAGLSLINTKGICASNGYIIAWADTAIAWSAETNPVDFVPSTITGAGGGAIQEAKGKILFCVPTSFGFIIYCNANCVSATYTGNSRFPFNFREIKGAGGGISIRQVAQDSTYNYQYAITTKGIQLLYANYAETDHAFVTDWIQKLTVQYFDVATLSFVTATQDALIGGTFFPEQFGSLNFIGNRYLVYSFASKVTSYTVGLYSYALIYDLELERWGLIKAEHNDCFDFNSVINKNSYGPEQAQIGAPLGFMTNLGALFKSYYDYSADSVIILGKFQYVRNRRLCLDEAVVDLVYSLGFQRTDGQVYAIPITEGQIQSPAMAGIVSPATTTSKAKKYYFNLDAESFLLVIVGSFQLNTVALTMHLGGKF